ncbi:MAG TPA: hypothetical protein DEQ74_01015 [Wolbachia sp.]|jgi:hypothetical protein|uniref:WD0745 family porin n=1 Tax=Wolbachia endosymbiont of Pentalonia nigronervosa TaxID=1301914 RepID=UPI000EC7AB08|nr:porin [Wolbachia endosymbiont of Pentalonia nigronervosa]MBD0391096.1 porin [Wolbachia endosymbiont of Pentalonia nigronervosa]HCE59404.1 hypothetical protein [Wolbachia sp.]
MRKSVYTKTALASLLTLYSFSGFTASEEVKKQGNNKTSQEVMKTSNKKLKAKMDRICNADPEKKAKEAKKRAEEEAMRKAEEEKRKAEGDKKKADEAKKKADDAKKKADEEAMKKAEKSKKKESLKSADKKSARKKQKVVAKTVETDGMKSVANRNIESKAKIADCDDSYSCCTQKRGVKITFGGTVDAQGYGKVSAGESDKFKHYNVMAGRAVDYYSATPDKIKGNNPLFPEGIGNIGDYSEHIGADVDATLHLRAENKNEDLGLIYGADLQFNIPVTKGKVSSKNRGAHVFVNSEYGDVRVGYQFGPEALMRLDATKIATVDGAADSNWFRRVNLEGSAASFPFYVTPRLYTESFSNESEKLAFRMTGKYNKDIINALPFRIAYYSPSYMGARLGVSYSPRYDSELFTISELGDTALKRGKRQADDAPPPSSNGSGEQSAPGAGPVVNAPQQPGGQQSTIVKNPVQGDQPQQPAQGGSTVGPKHVGPNYEHILSAGVSYEYDFNEYKVKVKAAAVGEYGFSKPRNKDKHMYSEYVEYNDLMGVNLGVSADYKIDESQSAKFAASFAHLGKSGQPKGIKAFEPKTPEYKDIADAARVAGLKQFDHSTMYWTAGAGYQYENIYTSLTYFGSYMNDKDMLHDVALGVQYDLSPAGSKSKFVPYAALHYFRTDEKQDATYKITLQGNKEVSPNTGFLLLTGVKFSF